MSEPSLNGSFLARLSPTTREAMLSLAQSFHYGTGETIFREGDLATMLYLVKAGTVAIQIQIPSKGRQTIQTVGPGDPFSWSALVEPQVHTASARAVEKCAVFGIRSEALAELFDQQPRVGLEVYRALAAVITKRLVATRLQLLDVFAA